jgi:hypothetical protein
VQAIRRTARVARMPVLPARAAMIAAGLVLGAALSAIDLFVEGGEVSPIVVVVLLFATTGFAGLAWGARGWRVAVPCWACLPLSHALLRLLGLPDTLHPATWGSIVRLAAFTATVAVTGTGSGLLLRRLSAAGRTAP